MRPKRVGDWTTPSGSPLGQFKIAHSCEQAQIAAIFERQHVAQVKHTLRAGPVVGHIADVVRGQTSAHGLLLPPAIERRGVVQITREGRARPVGQPGPQIDMGHETRVVIPNSSVRQPSGFGGNIFLGAGLHQADVALHNRIVLGKHQARIDGVG